jgi:hypothetical protein
MIKKKEMVMNRLFEATEINGMKLSNRFVRTAPHEGMAEEDGAATPKLTQTMVDLAKGGVGFIITSHMYVSPEGKAGPFQLGIYSDDLVDGLKSSCDAVHNAGGKIVAQLSHAGNSAVETAGHVPYAVSEFKENSGPVVVGAIGDDLRMDYTAVGNTTNLAPGWKALRNPVPSSFPKPPSDRSAPILTAKAWAQLKSKGKKTPSKCSGSWVKVRQSKTAGSRC